MDLVTGHIARTGVVLRREIIAAGLQDRDIAASLRSGALRRIRHGAYTTSERWDAASPEERHLLRARAFDRQVEGEVVFSHTTAALLHGLPVWGADLTRLHATRDHGTGRIEAGVVHHVGVLGDDVLVDPGSGLHVTTPARAVLEHASIASVESGLVTADAALRTGLELPALDTMFDDMERWPGTRRAQIVVRLADAGAESPGESRARYLFWREGIPAPQLQYEIRDRNGDVVARTDFAWPEYELFGEFDGRVKYAGATGDALFAEKRREDLIRELTGWRFIRFIWEDLAHPARTAERIRRVMGIVAA